LVLGDEVDQVRRRDEEASRVKQEVQSERKKVARELAGLSGSNDVQVSEVAGGGAGEDRNEATSESRESDNAGVMSNGNDQRETTTPTAKADDNSAENDDDEDDMEEIS
jgi:hypothetical protein